MDDSEQLRELHDTYVWEVNAAVGEGRLDLVWQLADQFLDQAVQILTDDQETTCGRADCLVCHGARPQVAVRRRHRWSRRGSALR